MPTKTVTATALARNFSEFLNQVRYQGVTLEVTRGTEVVACVSPPPTSRGFPIDQLDGLLDSLPRFSPEEADAFLDDIHAGVEQLTTERSAWDS